MPSQIKIIKRAFNAGETSKAFKWRNDTEKHAYSCERLENFYVSPLGAISRREGTRFLTSLGSTDRADSVRLVPFEYNRELSLIAAFHSADDGKFNAKSAAFELPEVFSMCMSIPEGFNRTGEILRKDTLTLVREADGTFILSSGLAIASFKLSNRAHKAAFVFRQSSLNVYVDGVLLSGYPVDFEGSFRGSAPLEIFQTFGNGDVYGIKIFNFDISRPNPCYGLEDYQSGAAAEALSVSPQWKTGAAAQYDCKYNIVLNTPEIGPVYPTAGWTKALTKYGPDHAEVSYANGAVSIDAATLTHTRSFIKQQVPNDFSGNIVEGTTEYNAFLGFETQYRTLTSEMAEIQAQIDNSTDEEEISQLEQALLLKSADRNAAITQLKNYYGILYCSPEWTYSTWEAFWGANSDRYETEDALLGACLNREYAWKLPDTEIIYVPFSAKAGAEIEFSANADAANTELELMDSDGNLHPLVSGTQILQDVEALVFTMKHQNGSDPHYEGQFLLNASYREITSQMQYSFEADKVVLFDVYGIDGAARVKDAESPIPARALQQFQYKQVGGEIYIAHSSMRPQKFAIDSDGNFEWSDAAEFYPSADEPESGLKLTCGNSEDADESELYPSSSAVSISADRPFFSYDMVGSQLKIEYDDKAEHTYKWKFNSAGATTAFFPACGKVGVYPEGGVWDGVLILEESVDDGESWSEIGRTTSIQGSSNASFEREVYDVKSLVRARMLSQNKVADTQSSVVDANTEGCFFNMQTDATAAVWVEIIAVNSDTAATVKLLNPCRKNFVSTRVYRSSWGPVFGYPRAVEIHEERLAFGGTLSRPATIWLSQTNNWDNFRSVSNLDTDPLAYTLASDDGEPVSWLVSRSDLMVGMGSSEWSLGSRDAGQALTASIVHAASQSDDGAEYIMPAKAGGMVMFVRRGNREIASISYDFANDSYNAVSLTTMNPDLLKSGVVSLFNQLSPNNKIYAVCKDGALAVFTYDRENNVAAWARFTFGDGVVSAIALSTGRYRSIFLAVKRDGFLCLERLDPNEQETGNWLDCVPISENAEVPEGLKTSVKYESVVKTTPVFLEGNVRVLETKLYLLNSLGGKFRVVGFDQNGCEFADDWRGILERESEFLQDPQPRDYRYAATCNTGYLEEGAVEISTDSPAPFELAAIGIKAKG